MFEDEEEIDSYLEGTKKQKEEYEEIMKSLDKEMSNFNVTVLHFSEPDFKWEYAHETLSERTTSFRTITPEID